MEIPTFDRYQILTARVDKTKYYGVLDMDIGLVVAEGTKKEMQEYIKLREQQDKMNLWR